MKRPFIKQIAGLIVLAATIAFFIYYFAKHPEVGARLRSTPPSALVIILFLYFMSVVAIALITAATLKLCKITIGKSESVKLTAYSSLVNFFGPLQSGPAFRAIYLKKKHGASLKKYAAATLIYYLVYGFLGCLFVASYWLDWRLAVVIVLGLVGLYILLKTNSISTKLRLIDAHGWYYLALATLFQVLVMTAIYYEELRTIAPGTSLHQAIIYTGAANLALFVSLTPGAIGFRESFLSFTQNLHHINNTSIIATNILDRTMYITLLGILALGIFATHTKEALTSNLSDKNS